MDVEAEKRSKFETEVNRPMWKFSPSPCRIIEVRQRGDTLHDDTFVFDTDTKEDDASLLTWIKSEKRPSEPKNHMPEPCLRLIVGRRVIHENGASRVRSHMSDDSLNRLPFSRATFKAIMDLWSLPRTLLKAIHRKDASYTGVLRLPDQTKTERNGCVMRIGSGLAGQDDLILALSWNLKTWNTYGIVLGCTGNDETYIRDTLPYSRDSAGHPLLALAPFTDIQLRRHLKTYLIRRAAFSDAQQKVGLDAKSSMSRQLLTSVDDHLKSLVDYSEVIKTVMDNFRSSGALVTNVRLFQTQLQKVTDNFCTTGVDCSTLEHIQKQYFKEHRRRLAVQAGFTLEGVKNIIEKCRLQNSEDSLLMSAIWNLAAKQDNFIARYIAEDSRRLTEQSLRMAQASQDIAQKSKELAEEARELNKRSVSVAEQSIVIGQRTAEIAEQAMSIADATKRDSTAMVAIATLTMIFLPLSYVATLLGMPIFNWQGANGHPLAKRKHVVIYVSTAIPLTLVVVALWALWWVGSERHRKKQRKQNEERLAVLANMLRSEQGMKESRRAEIARVENTGLADVEGQESVRKTWAAWPIFRGLNVKQDGSSLTTSRS